MGITFDAIAAAEAFLAAAKLDRQKEKLTHVIELLDEVVPSFTGHEDFGKLRSCRRAVAEALQNIGGPKILDALDPPMVKEVTEND